MSVSTLKKMGIIVGVKNAILAKLESDTSSGAVYATALKRAPGLIEIAITASVLEEMLGADDVTIWDILRMTESLDVSATVASLGKDGEAYVLGHEIDDKGVMHVGQDDKAPYLALGFIASRSDGSEDYIWLNKGMFKPTDTTFRTKEKGKINWQLPKLTGTFIPRIFDGKLMAKINDKDADADATTLQTFFDSVYMPGTTVYNIDTTPISEVFAVAALPTENIEKFAVYALTAVDGVKEEGSMWRYLNGTWEEYGAA